MDYGKLAYLKASDLEALMEKSRESDRGICCVTKENVAGSVSIGTCYGGTVIAFRKRNVGLLRRRSKSFFERRLRSF